MRSLIVICTDFTLKHSVLLMDDEKKENISAIHLLPEEIAHYAISADVQKIYLKGPILYCEGVKEEIAQQLSLEYNNTNIEIEVI